MTGPFVFRGTAPYVMKCRDNHPDLPLSKVGHALAQDAVGRVGHALAQASLADPKHRAAIAAEAQAWLEVLELAAEGVRAAILDVHERLGLPAPGFARGQSGEPEAPAPSESPKAPAPKHRK